MSFDCDVRDALTVSSFEKAENIFRTIRRFKGQAWYDSNIRGLGNQRQAHYTLVKQGDTYQVCLYGSPLITYHRPAEGEYKTEVYCTSHRASAAWIWKHTNMQFCTRFNTTEGELVSVPTSYDSRNHTVIVRTNDTKLLVREKSWHPRIYTKCSTPEDRAERVALKAKLETIVDLAMHRCVWEHAGEYNSRGKDAFDSFLPTGYNRVTRVAGGLIAHAMSLMKERHIHPSDALIESILEVANVGYNNYQGQPTLAAYKKAFTEWLVRQAGATTQSGKKYYPQFPTFGTLPGKIHLEY